MVDKDYHKQSPKNKSIRIKIMMNTDNKNKVEELVQREEVKDTPFTIVTTEEGSFVTMGKYRLSEPKGIDEVRKETKQITWNRLIQVIMLLHENMKEFDELSRIKRLEIIEKILKAILITWMALIVIIGILIINSI